MNPMLWLGQLYAPALYKRKKLAELYCVTASAFQCEMPELKGLTFEECLRSYAEFTRDKAEESIRRGTEIETRRRLYNGAFAMAQEIKRNLHVERPADVIKTAKLVYKILGIEFAGDNNGGVVISRCFFSSYYSSPVCRLISSLDEGLLEGLSGGSFRFTQRITDGNPYCRALLLFGGGLS